MQTDTPTDVIFIGGRSGVGKSSVAAEVSQILARADIRHALIEGDNLDQAYPQPWRDGIKLAEQNLAAMWKNYRAAGYSRLIFTNSVSVLQIAELSAALGGETHSSAVLLTATDATAAHRLSQREIGSALDEHIGRSSLAARRLDAANEAVVRIATDDRTVAEIAHEILVNAGWLSA
ncbi:adenylyl-sulfate kinase [Microbacterium sp. AZCO]|uniref:adenylyl-sulfate kinase n=1 Tax=Microbacterium sp. AZCO TaxID=3142976 RepID=UPI0031F3BEAD